MDMKEIVERTAPKAHKKRGRPAKTQLNGMGRPKKEESVTPEQTPVEKTHYVIDITIGDTTLHGEGATAHEALAAVQRPSKITTKVFLSISDGTKRKDIMFMPLKAKRLFFPQAQYVQARNLLFLMK